MRFSCGEQLLNYEAPIDILFLDIQMRGIDGMETARELRRRRFQGFLIFITVLKEMVFSSFEVQAYDYLVKPLKKGQFEKTMERLFASMKNARQANLLVQRGCESRIIPLDEIVYCEIIDRKVYLHLASLEVTDFYDRIDHLEKKLDDRFFRCHRSYLVNLKHIQRYSREQISLKGGAAVPVSRSYAKECMRRLMLEMV